MILVTGSEGFVGKALITGFLNSGHEVVGIDRVSTSNLSYKFHHIDLKNEILLDPISYD